ncbi:MAG: diaminopimelate epimerase [Bacteroidales bacterium]|nr:diaminopimelate epimerase [Bacteroidales bacterium]
MADKIHFYKYQGAGNDFILLDNRKDEYAALGMSQIALLCDRRFGIGADGLMTLQLDSEHGLRMRYYNADGREGSMCGNGGRCFTAFAAQLGLMEKELEFVAVDGLHRAQILNGLNDQYLVKLQMSGVGCYRRTVAAKNALKRNVFLLDTGSPHYVRFVGDVERIDVNKVGAKIRFSNEFPEGVNVDFVQIKSDNLVVRTYERGVENETFSCGTGVTASAIAYVLLTNPKEGAHTVQVLTRGGHLKVQFEIRSGNPRLKVPKTDVPTTSEELILNTMPKITEVYLEGLAQFVFEGDIVIN